MCAEYKGRYSCCHKCLLYNQDLKGMIISHLTWPGQLAFVAIALTEELVDFDNNHKIIMFQGITILTLEKHGIKMKKKGYFNGSANNPQSYWCLYYFLPSSLLESSFMGWVKDFKIVTSLSCFKRSRGVCSKWVILVLHPIISSFHLVSVLSFYYQITFNSINFISTQYLSIKVNNSLLFVFINNLS